MTKRTTGPANSGIVLAASLRRGVRCSATVEAKLKSAAGDHVAQLDAAKAGLGC